MGSTRTASTTACAARLCARTATGVPRMRSQTLGLAQRSLSGGMGIIFYGRHAGMLLVFTVKLGHTAALLRVHV